MCGMPLFLNTIHRLDSCRREHLTQHNNTLSSLDFEHLRAPCAITTHGLAQSISLPTSSCLNLGQSCLTFCYWVLTPFNLYTHIWWLKEGRSRGSCCNTPACSTITSASLNKYPFSVPLPPINLPELSRSGRRGSDGESTRPIMGLMFCSPPI